MICYTLKRLAGSVAVFVLPFFISGCVWLAAGAAAVGVAGVAAAGGVVSETDDAEMALAVEKAIYAIEKEGGVVTDLSFADGYVKGTVNDYKISIRVYEEDDGAMDVIVRASRHLISNADLAEKILNNYRDFKR